MAADRATCSQEIKERLLSAGSFQEGDAGLTIAHAHAHAHAFEVWE